MKFKAPNPTPRGLCRRVPPAIFPPIMGLFGLGLAWRRAAGSYALPQALPDAILGAVTLLFLFAFGAYAIKVLRRPAVVAEEVRILPGRAGLAAAVLSIYLMSMAIFPFGAGLSRVVLFAGFGLHAALVLILLVQLARGPAEQRRVTPVWHLNYVGFIIGALAGTLHAYYMPAFGIFLASALIAALIWAGVPLLLGYIFRANLADIEAAYHTAMGALPMTLGFLGLGICAFVLFRSPATRIKMRTALRLSQQG